MDAEQLKNLPSTFYRVAVKCLVFNDANELLVARNDDGKIEIPGGGWEHNETLTECVERELQEEIGVSAEAVGEVRMVLSGKSNHGWAVLRVAVDVELQTTNFAFNDEAIVGAFYVSKQDFSKLSFCSVDAAFAAAADQIWANR